MRRMAVVLVVLMAAVLPVRGLGYGAQAAPAVTPASLQADFNNDGADDLAVGVRGEDVAGAADAGAVNVLYGSGAGLTGTGSQQFTQVGSAAETGDRFGQALAKGRFFNDFNGDAFSDLAVGVPLEDVVARPDAGLVNLLEGSAADGLVGSAAVLVQGADLGGGARVGGAAEAGDVLGVSVE
jgi:hypothetical protein